MTTVKKSWKRIAAWYERHVPSKDFRMAPPATAAMIQEAERHLGNDFPDSVREMYALHNGSFEPVFPYGYLIAPLSTLLREWNLWLELEHERQWDPKKSEAEGPIDKSHFWNPKWIPIITNESGDHSVLDLSPAKRGTVGQILAFNHEAGAYRVEAPSFEAYLDSFASDLERGTFVWSGANGWVCKPIDL